MAGKLSRRDFIKRSAVGVIASGAMLSSINISAFTRSATAAKAVFRRSGDDIVVKLSENAALSKSGGSVKINDELMLIRNSETTFLAIRTICTHKGCDVELEGNKFVCPCHGSEFSLTGKVETGPAEENLKTFETIFDSDKGTVTIKTDGADKKEGKSN